MTEDVTRPIEERMAALLKRLSKLNFDDWRELQKEIEKADKLVKEWNAEREARRRKQ